MSADVIVIITGILAATSCALIGSFLVLRQNAMLGDAISHAVLPGLVIAFLITASRNVLPMLVGAAVMGLFTAYLTESLSRTKRLYSDAALGVVFTALFAIGVILVAVYTDSVDLDQDCVLYGEIAYTPWNTLVIGGSDLGPRPLWILGGVLLADLLFVVLFYRQLVICSFDPGMARAVGINERLWHYLLMTMVSLTVVAAFESVGAILVVAMLIVPGATAYLLTSNLKLMLILSVAAGAVAAVGGFYGAAAMDASIAGMMTVVTGTVFALAVVYKVITTRLARRATAQEGPTPPSTSTPAPSSNA
ncbi:iron chelate uptake ABC transporter family permease subunit [candidate division GN15 bacterium]|nr:iron chelate uptake ABC transporter family permease subunit [candidate division GN15 bacterium]